MQDEYWALRNAYGEQKDDYTKNSDEHTLNKGTWKWMNYVEKGTRTNELLFKKHCPTTV